MKYITPLALLWFLQSAVVAQNLVPNPSFELYSKCPTDYNVKYKKEFVTGWYMATGGTPDYFNSCTRVQVGVPQNIMGTCLARDGQAYVGLILLLEPLVNGNVKPTDYREYIETKLNEPLVKHRSYVVTVYFSVAPYSTYAINRLGVYFSEKEISRRRFTGVLDFKPQISIDTTKILTEKQAWFALKDTFEAKGNERFMTIGNFCNDKRTSFQTLDMTGISKVQQAKITDNKIAYYYIDLVSVVPLEGQDKQSTLPPPAYQSH